MHPETLFKNRIRPLLECLPRTFVIKIQQMALRGDPDFVLCVAGIFVALELKRDEKEKPMPLQEHRLKGIEKAGGRSFVVHPGNWPEVYRKLQALAQAS